MQWFKIYENNWFKTHIKTSEYKIDQQNNKQDDAIHSKLQTYHITPRYSHLRLLIWKGHSWIYQDQSHPQAGAYDS